jgi:hypothetical protein
MNGKVTAALAAGAMVVAQMAPLAPALAAELGPRADAGPVRVGAFAGARLRISLQESTAPRARLGLAVAPQSLRMSERESRSARLGEGVELDFAGREPIALRMGGQNVGRELDHGRRLGLSPFGKAAIVGGVVILGLATLALLGRSDE